MEPNVPYVPIRVFCGLLGALTVPIAYLTMKKAGYASPTALLVAFMICYGKIIGMTSYSITVLNNSLV